MTCRQVEYFVPVPRSAEQRRVRQVRRPVEGEHRAAFDEARRGNQLLRSQQVEAAEVVGGAVVEEAPTGRKIVGRPKVAVRGQRRHEVASYVGVMSRWLP